MAEPEKPFACIFPECGMSFTNEDHLNVHTKKHDMILQLGIEQKAAFVADQTPTPTRFIRNCEEVGLFQDLQTCTVNPFDEGFKRAMEAKTGVLSLENAIAASSGDDVLHTPQMFPLMDGVDSVYSTTNNQRNITISRSSSDESGAVKEYETTTISKLTNEVTTISRLVGKQDIAEKADDNKQTDTQNKDKVNETSVSYTNNVIIHSNVEIRKDAVVKDNIKNPVIISYKDSLIKDATSVVTKDLVIHDSNKLLVPPIMSQKSLDFVVDSFTSETAQKNIDANKCNVAAKRNADAPAETEPKVIKKPKIPPNKTLKQENKTDSDASIVNLDETGSYEVYISLPNGKQVRMKPVEDAKKEVTDKNIRNTTKEKLKSAIAIKKELRESPTTTVHVPIAGTLYPVTVVHPILSSPVIITNDLRNMKVPIPVLNAKSNELQKSENFTPKGCKVQKNDIGLFKKFRFSTLKSNISKLKEINLKNTVNNRNNSLDNSSKVTCIVIDDDQPAAPAGDQARTEDEDDGDESSKAAEILIHAYNTNSAEDNNQKVEAAVTIKTNSACAANDQDYESDCCIVDDIDPIANNENTLGIKITNVTGLGGRHTSEENCSVDVSESNATASEAAGLSGSTRNGILERLQPNNNCTEGDSDSEKHKSEGAKRSSRHAGTCRWKGLQCASLAQDEIDVRKQNRGAASKRYRDRKKNKWNRIIEERRHLVEENQELSRENEELRALILSHSEQCEKFKSMLQGLLH